jgi:hypothetical protein
MGQIFHPATNTIAKTMLYGGLVGVVVFIGLVELWYKSAYATQSGVPVIQTVPFSHKHHVSGLGIDCRYCHTGVETSSFAGVPPTQTCMTCHSRIWTVNAEMLQPVRDSLRTNKPLRWVRVNDLPDYAYFDHSIHIAKGVACVTCHGPVGDMPLTWRHKAWHMSDCVDCHRHPQDFIVDRSRVFSLDAKPDPELGRSLVEKYHVVSRTDCSTCHR